MYNVAIDDGVNSYGNQVADNGYVATQPASGDEWLFTAILCETTTKISPDDDAGTTKTGLWGGITTKIDNFREAGLHPITLFASNSDYPRIQNTGGVTANVGFSALKSKD